MALELFGIDIAHYAAISAVISFLISGHRSIFPSQILAMKKSGSLTIKMGEDIEHAEIELDQHEQDKVNKIRDRIAQKREALKNKKRK